MLTSLGVKNYRNLKSLEIEKLARVNLIAGKNNTGKTSLLEAVSMYASRGSLHFIDTLLKRRGEFYSGVESNLENNLRSYSALFHGRKIDFSESRRLLIGPLENVTNQNDEYFLRNTLNIRFVKLYSVESVLKDEATDETITQTRWKVLEKDEDEEGLKLRNGLWIAFDKKAHNYKLDDPNRENDFLYSMMILSNPPKYQFVRTFHTDEEIAGIWDHIASTDKEKYLVDALKLIDKDVESLDFIKDESKPGERKAVVRIRNNRLPLKSMGDGMNRILTIILALVNAGDGYLLIDEFENGLHYTVQEDLWKMIFQLAKELNVQVFATTHSNDCIRAFENVLNDGNKTEGQYFRLEKFGEIIKPIFYSPNELEVAIDQNIETR